MNIFNKKKLFAFSLIIILLSVIVISLYYFSQENKYGKRVVIKNYSSKIKNLPNDARYILEVLLYETIKNNNQNPDSVKDAEIRNDSNIQNYDNQNQLYTGTFIIDISSIKQSYRANYRQTKLQDKTIEGGYPLTITCLGKKDMLYPDFKCSDRYQNEKSAWDPILDKLPYNTLNYSISPEYNTDNKLILIVNISVSESDYKVGLESVIEKYKIEVNEWIRSLGLNPDSYELRFNY